MSSFRVRHTRMLVLLFLALGACSGGGGGLSCGGCLSPIPGPNGTIANYEGPKTNNSVDVRLSQQGFDYLNTNWQLLLETALNQTDTTIHIPVACQSASLPVLGTTWLCDRNFDQCSSNPAPCDVQAHILDFGIEPQTSGTPGQEGIVTLAATVTVQTGTIPVRTQDEGVCDVCFLGDSFMEGHINFDSTNNPLPLTVNLDLTLDARSDPQHPVLSFSVENIQGLQNLDISDLSLGGDNCCGDITFSVANFATQDLTFLLNFIIQQLQSTIDSQVQSLVAAQTCRKCGAAGEAVCPTGQNGGQDSTCSSGTCQIGGTCLPLMAGLEGIISPGALLGKYGVPADSEMAISAVAGGNVDSADATAPNAGLTLGLIGGAESFTGGEANAVAPCVPDLPPPSGSAPPVPDFDGQEPDGGYQLGLGVSDYFLNEALYSAHRSGALCIAIDGQTIDLLNTGLFKTFLPSLGLLAGSSTQDAPMMVALRPLQAPTIDIGEGTYDPTTNMPIDPLLTVTLHDVDIDIYALIEDRWSRLFTLTLDIQLPMSLIVDGCPQGVTPALGDLHNLITVTHAPSGSELLAEDPSVLQGLIPAVIGLAQPALASALQPIAVPSVSGFSLHIDGLQGIGNRSGTSFDDLGLYGNLELAGQCDAASVHTRASIVQTFVPTAAQVHPAAGQQLPWPSATIAVGESGYEGDAEYDYRIDEGLWTTFKPGPQLVASDPRLLIEGHHSIDVRGRPAHGKGIADPQPVRLDFLVDWEAPAVHLTRDASGQFNVAALDNVTGPQALQYRYTVGNDTSAWGPARPIDAQAIDEVGKLTVEVMDEAGNVGASTWHGAETIATSGIVPPAGGVAQAGHKANCEGGAPCFGCGTAAGGTSLLGFIALGLMLLGRRRR